MNVLKNEADRHKAFEIEIERLRSGMWEGARLTNAEIEDIARDLQNMLWKYKDKIWKHKTPEFILDVLQPDIVLTKILGYRFERVDSLGQHEVNGEVVDVAGMIEKEAKRVFISDQFEQETQDFTMAHELGHALLHKEVTAHRDRGLNGSPVRGTRPLSERQADKFGAYFLMPEKQVRRLFMDRFGTDKFILNENTAFALNQGRVSELRTQWKENEYDLGLARALASAEQYQGQHFYSLASVFRVSEQTMAIRLKELGLVED